MLTRLWNDEAGALLSAEIVLVGTILVIGVLTGLTSVRDAVVTELADVAGAIASVDQSYSYSGVAGHGVQTFGSAFRDNHDFCDINENVFSNSKCVVICTMATGERVD